MPDEKAADNATILEEMKKGFERVNERFDVIERRLSGFDDFRENIRDFPFASNGGRRKPRDASYSTHSNTQRETDLNDDPDY